MDVPGRLPPRRWLVRGGLAVLLCLLALPAAQAALSPQSVDLGPGAVQEPADRVTYVSVQGFHFAGYGNPKKPARLVAADRNADLRWHVDGDAVGARWFYDVDPLADGHLLVTATHAEGTVVFALDPDAGEVRWSHEMPIEDTHDATMLDDDRLLVANMRAYDGEVSDDRLFVEDLEDGTTGWEWRFRDHYPADTDGGFDEDWTHVNDVDVIGGEGAEAEADGEGKRAGRYVLASPRNFDQVIVVDRQTDEIVMRLGADDEHDVLYEQHNPDYLERADGTPVVLVADSENDRIVEYERDCGDADPRLGAGTPPADCEWERVWAVGGFNWPRDADRLPNGNTLVTDTLNHRVVEITPAGEVVWEFHAPWAPYDAERGERGSNGPAMADRGVEGTFQVRGGSDEGPAARYTVADAIADAGAGTAAEPHTDRLATRWAHYEPWFRPVWMGSWAALSTLLAGLVALGWGAGELVVNRRRLRAAIRERRP